MLFESTLASKTLVNIITQCRANGYEIYLIFFWLNHYELAIQRVKSRVNEGGHFIPDEDVKRRYYRGLNNLIEIYIPISDYWIIVDNTLFKSEVIVQGDKTKEINVSLPLIWEKIKSNNYEE